MRQEPSELDQLFRTLEEHNFRYWLEEEFFDEFVPISRHFEYMTDTKYRSEQQIHIATAMNYAMKGMNKMKQFLDKQATKAKHD